MTFLSEKADFYLPPVAALRILAAQERHLYFFQHSLFTASAGQKSQPRFSHLLLFPSRELKITPEQMAGKNNKADFFLKEITAFEASLPPITEENFYPFAGFLSYEAAYALEESVTPPPLHTLPEEEFPLFVYRLYRLHLLFDAQELKLTITKLPGEDPAENIRLNRMFEEVKELLHQAASDFPALPEEENFLLQKTQKTDPQTACRLSFDEFGRLFDKIQTALRQGDIFQCVISGKFSQKTQALPADIFAALAAINPSPYSFYLHHEGKTLLGASPEMQLEYNGEAVITHPIAGTRPVGKNSEENLALIKDLLADSKEQSEHLMLVDLARNDLGRHSVPGSVLVTRFMQPEIFSHVIHAVSEVKGRLKQDSSPLTALLASFPAGTLSGAPKVKALQIIRDLERKARGPYGGVMLIGNQQFLKSCIIIRSLFYQDQTVYWQAGAGIVLQSDKAAEYAEINHKAAAVMQALTLAEGIRSKREPAKTERKQA